MPSEGKGTGKGLAGFLGRYVPLEPALEGPPGLSLGLPGPLLTVGVVGPCGGVLLLLSGMSMNVPDGDDCEDETDEVESAYAGSGKNGIWLTTSDYYG